MNHLCFTAIKFILTPITDQSTTEAQREDITKSDAI
jgi:hypothetical protein